MSELNVNYIADNVKYLREISMLTYKSIAEFLDMDEAFYINCEDKKADFELEHLLKLSQLFNIQFSFFFKFNENAGLNDTLFEYSNSVDNELNIKILKAYKSQLYDLNDELDFLKLALKSV